MKKNKKKKQIFYSLLGLFGLLVVLFGTTYAIFTYSKEGTTENVVTAGTIDLSYLTDTGNNVGISLTEAYPVSDSVAMVSTNPDNIFDFTLSGQNDGNTDIPFEVTLEKTDISDLPEDVVKIYLTDITESDEEEILEPTLYSDLYTSVFKKEDVVEEKVIYQGKIEANTTYNKTLRLRMWVKEDIDFDSGDYDELTFDTIVNIYSDSTISITNICDIEPGQVWNFDYTGSEQTFEAPCSGNYKLETWGAEGGRDYGWSMSNTQSKGAYVSGNINLNKNKNIFIYVGGKGSDGALIGSGKYLPESFNGGGAGIASQDGDDCGGSGGGATDIRLISGNWNNFESLKSRIMVSAGGAGGAVVQRNFNISGNQSGGTSGGLMAYGNLYRYYNESDYTTIEGTNYNATQIFGYSFGKGENGYAAKAQGYSAYAGGSGAAGGYYGGYSDKFAGGSGGGSSFISGHNGCDAISEASTSTNIIHTGQPNHYSGLVFTNTIMIDGAGYNWTNVKGSYVGQLQPDGTTSSGHSGNGYARITYLGNN